MDIPHVSRQPPEIGSRVKIYLIASRVISSSRALRDSAAGISWEFASARLFSTPSPL